MSLLPSLLIFWFPGKARPPRARVGPRAPYPPRIEPLEERCCPSQYLLVADQGYHSVLRYDGQDGHFVDAFVSADSGRLRFPYLGLTTDAAHQNLLVSCVNTHSIQRYRLDDGSPNPADGLSGANFAMFGGTNQSFPWGVAVGPTDGDLYVTEYAPDSVVRYNGTTGAFDGIFVPSGSGGLDNGNDIHFGPDGNLYVATVTSMPQYIPGTLLRFDGTTGAPLPAPGRSGANFINPIFNKSTSGFAFGPDGNLYLAVGTGSFGTSIWRFDGTTGDPLPAPGQTGAIFVPPGLTGGIMGITFGDDGNLYVTDSAHGIREFDGQTGTLLGDFVTLGSGGLRPPFSLLFYDAPERSRSLAGRTAFFQLVSAFPSGTVDVSAASAPGGVAASFAGALSPTSAEETPVVAAPAIHSQLPTVVQANHASAQAETESFGLWSDLDSLNLS